MSDTEKEDKIHLLASEFLKLVKNIDRNCSTSYSYYPNNYVWFEYGKEYEPSDELKKFSNKVENIILRLSIPAGISSVEHYWQLSFPLKQETDKYGRDIESALEILINELKTNGRLQK